MGKILLTLFLMGILNVSFAQSNNSDPFMERLKRDFLNSRQLLDQFFQDDFLKKLDGKFFHNDGLGESSFWKEDEQAKTLVIIGELTEDQPLDVKLKNNNITVTANFEKRSNNGGVTSIQRSSFQRSFPVPVGTDPDRLRVEVKKEKGEIWIIFPKVQLKGQAPFKPRKTPTPNNEIKKMKEKQLSPAGGPKLRPLRSHENDLTI